MSAISDASAPDANLGRTIDVRQLVLQAGRVLSTSLDLDETLASVVRISHESIADLCSVNLFEEDGGVRRVALAHRDPEKQRAVTDLLNRWPASTDGAVGIAEVRRTGIAQLLPDITDEQLAAVAQSEEHLQAMKAAEIRSAMVVPLLSRGTAIGTISFSASKPNAYGPAELEAAEEFGRQAGLAIDNARLYMAARREIEERQRAEEMRIRAAEEIRLLYEAGRALGRTLDPDTIYDTVQSLVSGIMDCDGLLVSSYDPADDFIRCSYAWVEGEKIEPSTLPPILLNREGKGMQSQVIVTRKPLIFLDVEKRVEQKDGTYYHVTADGGVHDEPEPSSPTTKSVLMVPIITEDRVQGVVQVMAHRANAYTSDQLRMLEGLVLQMAAASRNAILYQQAQAEIVERKRAENRYRTLVAAITSLVWHADAERRFVRPQASWEEFTGQTWEEHQGDGWLAAIHPDDRDRTFRYWRRCIEEKRVFELEYRLWHQGSQRYRHVAVRAVPVVEAEGAVVEWLGTATDIHDVRVAQEQAGFLLALNDRIRDIVDPDDLLREVVWTLGTRLGVVRCWYADVDVAQGYIEVSQEFLSGGVSAKGRHPIEGENPLVLQDLQAGIVVAVRDTSTDEHTRDAWEAYEKIGIRSYISVPIVRGGELRAVLAVYDTSARLWSPEEVELCEEVATRAWLAVQSARARAEVLSLNQELERRVSERTSQLEAANHEMEGFTYTVAHDLRAPMRAIVSTSMILLQDYGERIDGEMRSLLERQAAAAKQLGILVDDLLKLSRIGRTELTKRPIDLSEMAQEVAREMQEAYAEPDGVEVRFEIEPALVASADSQLIRLVLQNLFENSIKFARPDCSPTIELGRSPTHAGMTFYVRDNGIGFDQQYVHKIFEPFERLHRQGDYPGTGVGLANVKRIVQRHGGQIWAEGREGQGATFYFTLP